MLPGQTCAALLPVHPSRQTLTVLPAKDGKPYVRDRSGEVWRLVHYISDSLSYEIADTPELFAASGEAFGHFQYYLRDFDSSGLVETIPDFQGECSSCLTSKCLLSVRIIFPFYRRGH